MPLIAQVDLPIDVAGGYTMRVAIDDSDVADVPVQVRAAAQATSGGMVS